MDKVGDYAKLVILSIAKNLIPIQLGSVEILRCAQNDIERQNDTERCAQKDIEHLPLVPLFFRALFLQRRFKHIA